MKVFSELRMWFLVMLAVGSFGILAGWAFDSTWLTVAAPVGAMFFYFLPARFRDRSLFDTYVFADSFYFLGFLFTLISLLVSLLGFAEGGVGADEITGSVTRFGVALLTTVIGLAVRVFLVNFRPEIDDSMAQAESALAQSSLELRNHLDQLNADLVVQTDSWTTSLSHAVSRANAELEAAYSSGAQVVRASAEHFAESTEKEARRSSSSRLRSTSVGWRSRPSGSIPARRWTPWGISRIRRVARPPRPPSSRAGSRASTARGSRSTRGSSQPRWGT